MSWAEAVPTTLGEIPGRDIVLDLSKRVAAASGREKTLSGHLCANSGRGRDIEVNLSKRVEADSGLERVSGRSLCTVRSGRDIVLNLEHSMSM